MSCSQVTIQPILGSECIGDSLPKINSNFSQLENAACDLYARTASLSSASQSGAGNLNGDVVSTGLTTTYNNVVPSTKGGAGSVIGMLKANGSGVVSSATPNVDYATPSFVASLSGHGNHTGDVTSVGLVTSYNNVVPAVKGGAGTNNGILKANGSGVVSTAVAGTDYVVPSAITNILPPGAIMPFYLSTAPSGWLECNGQSTAGYPALQAAIGSNVPDLRGEFIRGWDHGRGVDTGRSLGTTQADAFKSHTHSYNEPTVTGNTILYGVWSSYDSGATSSNTSSTGGTETRPRNVAFMYCIKT